MAERPPFQLHLHGDQSEGKLSLTEMTMGVGPGGPPLHVHPKHGEGFYVLEGELTIQVGDELLTRRRGTFAYAPPGTPHTLANLSDRDVRLLVLCTPAAFESWFEQIAAGNFVDPPAGEAIAVGPPISVRLGNRPGSS
jgi:quercetin dioxygenase-like cupin family protein